jgi:ribosomal protein L7/L12
MKIEITTDSRTLILQCDSVTRNDLRYISQFLRDSRPVTYDVFIADVGQAKINTIRMVREVTKLGLKEAKELVEKAPDAVVVSNVSYQAADSAARLVRSSGATVKLKHHEP